MLTSISLFPEEQIIAISCKVKDSAQLGEMLAKWNFYLKRVLGQRGARLKVEGEIGEQTQKSNNTQMTILRQHGLTLTDL